ncbi:MAG TPA: hypothetical protein VJJ51_10610 [Candidatus Methanoperedens sp.]|nr:hypothetical protein [Candidatus Methanoperedens sp.]HLB71481.1 hypothetical protein [Candidatus Methanoperedens sp.]
MKIIDQKKIRNPGMENKRCRDINHSILFTCAISLFFFSILIGPASAVDYTQIQWGSGISTTLHFGESIAYNGYSVEAITFAGPVVSDKYSGSPEDPVLGFVGLNISKNGVLINTTVLQQGDSYFTPAGDLKVTAKELPSKYSQDWVFEKYAPWVVLTLNSRGIPDLEVSINTASDEYLPMPGGEIHATIKIRNKGSADLVNVNLNLETLLQVKRGSLKNYYERIAKGESVESDVALMIPNSQEKKSYSIGANVSGSDTLGVSYSARALKKISIIPEPVPIPKLRKSTNTKIYSKDLAIVSLSLKNNAKYDLENVTISDYLPETFAVTGNNSLKWVVNIPAFGEWDIHYLVKASKPYINGILLPAASAEFNMQNEYYIISSDQPEIYVNGPEIRLNKYTDVDRINPGDPITVTVSAENIGNSPSKVNIIDQLPGNAIVLSGSTTHEEYLFANKEISFSYTFKTESTQSFKLPPPIAEYYELGVTGNKIKTVGNELEITIGSSEIDAANEAGTEITPDMTEIETPLPAESENPTDKKMSESSNHTEPYKEVNALLKMMLGCEDNSTKMSRPYSAYIACYFIKKDG